MYSIVTSFLPEENLYFSGSQTFLVQVPLGGKNVFQVPPPSPSHFYSLTFTVDAIGTILIKPFSIEVTTVTQFKTLT